MRPAIPFRVGRLAEARGDASPVIAVPGTSTQRAERMTVESAVRRALGCSVAPAGTSGTSRSICSQAMDDLLALTGLAAQDQGRT